MRRTPLLLTILFAFTLVLSSPVDARGRKDRKPAVDPELVKLVEPLIKALDDRSFDERERATVELMKLGPTARPALLPAKDHPSPEVRARIRRVLLHFREMERQEELGFPDADDWPTLKRGQGRRASSGLSAIRREPSVKWYQALDKPLGRPHFDSPLIATESVLYVISRTGVITALDRATGEQAWELSTGEPVHAPPVLAGSTMYVPGTSLTAIDVRTRRIQWRWMTDYGVSAAPLVHEGHVYAVERGEKLVSLDPKTGEVEWKARVRATASTPVRAGRVIVVGAEDGLWAFHHEKGGRRWHFETEYPVLASAAVLDQYLVFGDEGRNLYSVSADKGRPHWHRRFPEGAMREAPVVYGDAIFFSTDGGSFRALRGSDGGDMWTRNVGSYMQSSPCIAGGVAYLTAGTRLFAFDCASGDDAWRLQVPGRFSAPILLDGTLYMIAVDGMLVALE